MPHCNTSTSFGINTITLNHSGPTANRHEIITSGTSLDSYGLFLQRCPNGSGVSVKLGNSAANRQAEGLSYTFQIPPLADTFSLTYYYAVVFEDPNHAPSEQPRFSVSAYDVLTDAVINCAAYSYVSSSSIPGFQQSSVDADVIYKDWTLVMTMHPVPHR